MKKPMWRSGRALRILTVLCGALLFVNEAHAVLGGGVDSVHTDRLRFRGEHRQRVVGAMTSHEIVLQDGSIVREYVNASGQVFAVSWRTRLKPNLQNLLGAHYLNLGVRRATTPGVAGARQQQSARHPNLVVHSGGRMNAFAGLAYVPALVPKGFDADTLH